MSSRTLLSTDTTASWEQARPAMPQPKKSFHLQAPPLKRKERRKGRVFAGDDARQALSQSGHRCPPPSPTFSAPKRWQRFIPAKANSTDDVIEADGWTVTREEGKISPKHILAGDIRLEFPDHSDTESSVDGQMTPRPRRLSSDKSQSNRAYSDFSLGEYNMLSPLVSDSPSSTDMTDGTFGARRRRSSVASSARTPSSGEAYSSAHTVLNLPVHSPLTPRRMADLHSPKADETNSGDSMTFQARAAPTKRPWLISMAQDAEPLSATLKRIGAARKSRAPAGDPDAIEIAEDQQSFSEAHEHWSSQLAAEARDRAEAEQELSRSRNAVEEAETFFARSQDQQPTMPSRTLPRVTERRPVSGLAVPSHARPGGSDPRRARVQSTARGVAKGRSAKADDVPAAKTWSMQRMSTTLASYIFGNHFRARANELEVFYPSMGAGSSPVDSRQANGAKMSMSKKARGDGWGGLRPRSSWFQDFGMGPLISPRPTADAPAARASLRPLQLQAKQNQRGMPSGIIEKPEDEEWEDTSSPVVEKSQGVGGDAARPTSLKRLRVRFPSYLPQPSKSQSLQRSADMKADAAATTVVYTKTSAEGRPVVAPDRRRMRVVVVSMLLLACTAIAIALAIKYTRMSHEQDGAPVTTLSGSSMTRRATDRRALDDGTVLNNSRRSAPHKEPSRAHRHAMVLKAVKQSG